MFYIFNTIDLRFVTWAHLIFSIIILSPFFLSGNILIGSTDNLFMFFPNMLFAHEVFNDGDPGLWNPYLFGGMDFTSSTHNYLFYPLNWILFLFPEKYLILLNTIRIFLELWLLGVFGYLFFKEELNDSKWAFFSSTILQLGGYTFFSITTYPNLSMLLFSTMALYVAWTLEKRKAFLSYVYITLCAVLIILNSNMVYGVSFLLTITVLFVYRHWPNSVKLWRPTQPVLIFYSAMITMVLLSMVRVLPFIAETLEGTRLTEPDFENEMSHMYSAITLFIPEIMGFNFTSSEDRLWMLHVAGHSQFHTYTYFGSITAILLVGILFSIRETKVLFWAAIWAFATLWFLKVDPLNEILDIIFYPFVHAITPKIMIIFPTCILAGYAGMFIQNKFQSIQENKFGLTFIAILVPVLCVPTVFGMEFPQWLTVSKAVYAGVIALAVSGVYLFKHHGKIFNGLFGFLFISFLVALPCVFFQWPVLRENPFFISSFVYVYASLVALGFLLFFAKRISEGASESITRVFLTLALILIIAVVLFPFPPMTAVIAKTDYLLGLIGAVRLLVVFFFISFLIIQMKRKVIHPQWLFPFFMMILIVDLLPFNKAFSHIVTEPFVKAPLYPSKDHIIRHGGSENPNLIKNGSFQDWADKAGEAPDDWQVAEKYFSISTTTQQNTHGPYTVALENRQDSVGEMFQVVRHPLISQSYPFTFGAWVKTADSKRVQVKLTTGEQTSLSKAHTGSGQWEWLSVTHRSKNNDAAIQIHVQLNSRGKAHLAGPVLMNGTVVYPEDRPPNPDETRELFVSREYLDLKNYRMNNPHRVLKIRGNEIRSNMPTVYGVRMYGGINSTMGQNIIRFIQSFHDSPYPAGAGSLGSSIENSRLLDLFGVRYDLDRKEDIIIRTGALSRFMLYEDFKVSEDGNATLAQLKSPEFNPLQTVILARDPGVLPAGMKTTAKRVQYSQLSTSHIKISTEAKVPSILLFNDSYNKDWKAYTNGEERSMIRADFNFMAVAVPAGKNTIEFRYEPKNFYLGFKIFLLGGVVFLITVSSFYFAGRKSPPVTTDKKRKGLKGFVFSLGRTWLIVPISGVLILAGFSQVDFESSKASSITASSVFKVNMGPDALLEPGGGIWHSAQPPQYPEWVEMYFKKAKQISHLKIQSQSNSPHGQEYLRTPMDFIFQGSDDRLQWNNLLEIHEARFDTGGEWKSWEIPNERAFSYYRIYIRKNNGDPDLLTIQNIQIK